MKEEKKKSERPNRMEQDVENTSRTMKPGSVQGSDSGTSVPKGKGRGWHGDSAGHVRAAKAIKITAKKKYNPASKQEHLNKHSRHP